MHEATHVGPRPALHVDGSAGRGDGRERIEWQGRGIRRAFLDFTLYKAINGFAYGHDRFEDALRFFALDAQFFFIALLAILFLARGKWTSRNARHGVIAAGLAAALALAIAHGITLVWPRPRPYIAHPGARTCSSPHRAIPRSQATTPQRPSRSPSR